MDYSVNRAYKSFLRCDILHLVKVNGNKYWYYGADCYHERMPISCKVDKGFYIKYGIFKVIK